MNQKFFALIDIPQGLRWPLVPMLGEYDNPYIKSITPCTLENGVYKSWETGEVVKTKPDTQAWGLQVGTMFHLTDGREVLITRNCGGEEYLVDNVPFNPLTMVRREAKRYVEKKKKK